MFVGSHVCKQLKSTYGNLQLSLKEESLSIKSCYFDDDVMILEMDNYLRIHWSPVTHNVFLEGRELDKARLLIRLHRLWKTGDDEYDSNQLIDNNNLFVDGYSFTYYGNTTGTVRFHSQCIASINIFDFYEEIKDKYTWHVEGYAKIPPARFKLVKLFFELAVGEFEYIGHLCRWGEV